MTIVGSVVSGNSALGSGGGIQSGGNRRLEVVGTTFSGNRADRGGGLFVEAESSARVAASAVYGNEARLGGGLYNRGRIDLTDFGDVRPETPVYENAATENGGGIFTDAGGVTDVERLEQVFANLPNDFAGLGAVV